MHEAYEAVPILEKLPFQIETISAYDGNLIVGTKQGHLLMYSTVAESYNAIKVSLLRSNKNFSRKPINQVIVVPEHHILISLSDQIISVHDLTMFNFPLLFTLPKSKGATSFDVDVQHHTTMTGDAVVTIRLVVAVKRMLQFYYWKTRAFHELRKELPLNDYPRSVTWCGEAVVVSFKHDYWNFMISGEQKELFATGKGQEPLVTKLSDNCLGLQRDEKTVFVDADGNSVYNYPLIWPEQPLAMSYEAPYLIGVFPKTVLVQCHEPKMQIQTLNLEKARLLTRTRTNKKQKNVFAASVTHVWCLCPRLVSQQIPQLLSNKYFELAIKLADLWDENDGTKVKMKLHIEQLHAFNMFCEQKFQQSMKLFLNMDTDLLFVIGLYPGLVPEDYRNKLQYPHPTPQMKEEELKNALNELVDFLLERRHKLLKIRKSSQSDLSLSPAMKSQGSLLQIIDTTLLKAYLKTNESLVVPLLRMPDSHVSVEEGERVLRQAKKYNAVLLLLQRKGMHSRALQLLLRHATRPDSPLSGYKHTVEYLQNIGPAHLDLVFDYSLWIIKQHPEEGLKIFTGDEFSSCEVEQFNRTRVYSFLKKTDKSLVIPYLEHVIEEWGDQTPVLHNELINQYREVVTTPLPDLDDDKFEAAQQKSRETETKLLHFLMRSGSYTAATILVHFPHDDLYEERAVLYGRLGQHIHALKIYIEVLDDFDCALEYCHMHYDTRGTNSEVYTILLSLLLKSSRHLFTTEDSVDQSKEQMTFESEQKILQILENFSQSIDLNQTLKMLPDHVSLELLKPFLHKALYRLSTQQKERQLSRGLCNALENQTRSDLAFLHKQSVVLTKKDKCCVCYKRFTNSSAFAWLPKGGIVHFSCKEQII